MNTFSDLIGPNQSNLLIQCSDIHFFSGNYGPESSDIDVQNIYFPAKKLGESVPLEIPIMYENKKFELAKRGVAEAGSEINNVDVVVHGDSKSKCGNCCQ